MRRSSSILALVCLGCLPALATEPALPDVGGEPVRVYTNADLEPLDLAATPAIPAGVGDATGWDFVREFIDREHARLDAARRHEAALRRERETRPVFAGYGERYYGYGYGYPYGYGYQYGYGYGYRYGYGSGYGDRCAEPGGRSPAADPGPFGRRGSLDGRDAVPDRHPPQRRNP